MLMHSDPLRYAGAAVYPYSPNLERKFKAESRFDEEYNLSRHVGDELYVPRALCPVGPNDQRDKGEAVNFPSQPVPRPGQAKVFLEVKKALLAGMSGVVCAYTGWGKTVLGYFAAAILGVKTLVITTKDDIYQQWIDGACGVVSRGNPDGTNFLGLKRSDVGEIRGDKCEVVGKKFVVAMIHSLSKPGRYPSWITKGFGLVIFDECHRLPADQFQAVADMFDAYWRMGLSATVERSDGKEILIYSHVGPVIARTEVEELVPRIIRYKSPWECPRTLRSDPVTGEKSVIRVPHEPGKTAHIERSIAAHDERNAMLCDILQTTLAKGRQTVFFSTQIEHLRTVQRRLNQHHGVSGKNIGIYIHASTKAEKAARDKQAGRPILLTTYGMMSEGTNFPWLDTCLLGMPRAKVNQPVGRIRREYEDKSQPVVLDIVDDDSPVFAGYAISRLKWYQSLGCEITNMW